MWAMPIKKTYFIVWSYWMTWEPLRVAQMLIHSFIMFLHWGLQITLSCQSYYETLAYILHPPKGSKKFELSPIFSPIRKSRNLLDVLRRAAMRRQNNYSVNPPCGFRLQQGHFASIGNKSIMIYSLM